MQELLKVLVREIMLFVYIKLLLFFIVLLCKMHVLEYHVYE